MLSWSLPGYSLMSRHSTGSRLHLQLMKQCLELRIKVLSESHPDTLSTLMTLLQWSGVDLESLSSIVGDASTSGDE